MKKRTVLIVDDDKTIREQLEKELKRNFFITFVASDVKEAQEKLLEEDIDIILLDIMLPGIDGFELLTRIKEDKPRCQVIIITGHGTQEVAIRSLRLGAIDYIEKPIKLDVLRAALGRAQEKLAEKEELTYKNTILVLDDEKIVVNSLAKSLEKEGYSVFPALSGKEALQIIEQNKIDILVSDIRVGDINGIDFLEKAKNFYLDIEGIMVSGYKDQEMSIRALRAGAFDYITKPVNLDELLISIEKAINTVNLNRNQLYRNRELKLSSEIISKMNEELERKVQERTIELGKVQTQLFQTSKLVTLGEMAAGLAHEINQPLAGISLVSFTFSELLDRNQLSEEEIRKGVKDINGAVDRMSKIIQHVRTFARQDTLKFVNVDVNSTIQSGLNLLGQQLRLHEITVNLNLNQDLPMIAGEPFQLEQVWINLISNARDSLDDSANELTDGKLEKQITIANSIEKMDGKSYVVTRFTDNGKGMTQEEIDKAFEPFFTTKEVGKATGLGLAISFGIIENHQGKITIEPSKERGVTIAVFLPTTK